MKYQVKRGGECEDYFLSSLKKKKNKLWLHPPNRDINQQLHHNTILILWAMSANPWRCLETDDAHLGGNCEKAYLKHDDRLIILLSIDLIGSLVSQSMDRCRKLDPHIPRTSCFWFNMCVCLLGACHPQVWTNYYFFFSSCEFLLAVALTD